MPPTHTLTRTRQDGETARLSILAAIPTLETQFGYPPTQTDIAALCNLHDASHVRYYLHQLRDAGLVTFAPGKHGTLRLTVAGKVLLANFANPDKSVSAIANVPQAPDAHLETAYEDRTSGGE